jgi:hypothetical protein
VPIVVCWLPLLGGVLSAIGIVLVAAAVGAIDSPILPASDLTPSMVAIMVMPDQRSPVMRTETAQGRAGDEGDPGAQRVAVAARERAPGHAGCRVANLAINRSEFADLATVALRRTTACGDRRDVLMGLAALAYKDGRTATDPEVSNVDAAPRQADGIDLTAAALYGPPDRQPQAALEEEVLDGGRGRARVFLERTAAAPWVTP